MKTFKDFHFCQISAAFSEITFKIDLSLPRLIQSLVLTLQSVSLFDVLFQVLSPLSDSILAEKTVTVLDDKVKKKKKSYLACIIISYSYSFIQVKQVDRVQYLKKVGRQPPQKLLNFIRFKTFEGSNS